MEQAFKEYLINTTAIAEIVGDRIDWGLRPQGSALPAVTLTVVSRSPIDADDGDSGLYRARVQVDCWAGKKMTDAKALATECRRALSGKQFQSLDVSFDCWTENETDYAADGAAGTTMNRVSIDYLMLFTSPI